MILSDLSLSQSTSSDEIKMELENRLKSVLPEGSFKVILRSYQGDFRSRENSKINYQAMILLQPPAKKAALDRKNEIEALGFKVSPSGDIRAN